MSMIEGVVDLVHSMEAIFALTLDADAHHTSQFTLSSPAPAIEDAVTQRIL